MPRRIACALLLACVGLAGCGLSPSSIADAALYDLRPPPPDLMRSLPDGAVPCMQDSDCPMGGPRLSCRFGLCL